MSKVWLITDSARGLGRALAEAVLATGDCLVAGAHDPALISDLAQRYGRRVCPLLLDATDEALVYAAVNAALRVFGRIDVVVNHLGDVELASIDDMSDVHLRRQLETHFFGAVSMTRAALPILQEQGSGRYVQLAPIASVRGTPGFAAYQAARRALEAFSEVLAHEAAPFGVEVSFVEPAALHLLDSRLLLDTHPLFELHAPYEERGVAAIAAEPIGLGLQTSPGRRGCAAKKSAGNRVVPFPERPVAA